MTKERKISLNLFVKQKVQVFKAVIRMACFFALCAVPAFAEGIGDSSIATGTIKLLNDGSTTLLVALPIVAAVAIIYFSIRRSLAEDEQDGKMWSRKIKIALVCVVVGETISGIIKVLMSYYGG